MSQLHPLTEKIINYAHPWGNFDKADSIIRKYLEEKAKELWILGNYQGYSVLGISDGNAVAKPVEEVKVEKWCEHWHYVKAIHDDAEGWYRVGETSMARKDWVMCPICGIPRPTPKSKRELLAEKFKDEWEMPYWLMQPNTNKFKSLADIAIAFLESKCSAS